MILLISSKTLLSKFLSNTTGVFDIFDSFPTSGQGILFVLLINSFKTSSTNVSNLNTGHVKYSIILRIASAKSLPIDPPAK